MQTSNVWGPRGEYGSRASFDFSRRPAYTTEQAMFIQRLRDLLDKRRQLEGRLSRNDWHQRLLDKALYSTYRDCLALGLGDEARELIHEARELAA